MERRVFIISKFIGKRDQFNVFHFKGCYRGKRLREIKIVDGSFDESEEYLLAIEELEVVNQVLIGKHIKSKKIFT